MSERDSGFYIRRAAVVGVLAVGFSLAQAPGIRENFASDKPEDYKIKVIIDSDICYLNSIPSFTDDSKAISLTDALCPAGINGSKQSKFSQITTSLENGYEMLPNKAGN